MTATLTPSAKQQFFDANGNPLAGGKLYTYIAGTTSPTVTYVDSAGVTTNTNPIILDSRGEANVWLGTGAFKFKLVSATDVEIWTVDNIPGAPASNAALVALAASNGSSLVGFIQSGTNAIATTVQTKLRESVSVLDFGASTGATAAANVTAFQAALNYANSIGGCKVFVPKGTYLLNASLIIYQNTTFVGEGRTNTTLSFSQAGDGIQSTWPINSSTAANVVIRDMNIITTNGSNTGGGFADVGGTFLELTNVRFYGWKYNVILDQSEIVNIQNCDFESWLTAGIWIVNGADHTVGASINFTNRISILGCQFNAGNVGYCIADDGGANHYIAGNNFNGGNIQIWAAGVAGLTILNNEMEVSYNAAGPVQLSNKKINTTLIGTCTGFGIRDNTIGGTSYCVYMWACNDGEIKGNTFHGYSTAAIDYDFTVSGLVSGVSISSNAKIIFGAGKTYFPFFASARLQALWKQGDVNQLEEYYVVSALGATGSQVVTLPWIDGIAPGAVLQCSNADGTNSEQVRVTATSGLTFTATFASTKSANWIVRVVSQGWLPVMSGSGTAGTWTQTVNEASYQQIRNRVYFDATVTWTSMGTATGQLQMSLPVTSANVTNKIMVVSGSLYGAAGVYSGALLPSIAPNTAKVAFAVINTGTGAASTIAVTNTGTALVSGSYEV